MDHVLAKIKGLRKSPFKKLISDTALFENQTISLAACVDYEVDHNLDEDSWFKIERFSTKEYCLDILKGNFDSRNLDDATVAQYKKIGLLVSYQGGDFYIQKVTPSVYVNKKFIALGEVAAIEESKDRLAVNKVPDAIYLKNDDALVFKDLAVIASIFKGIDQLYKEATKQEVEYFLNEDFVGIQGVFTAESVSKPNRKRVALAMTTLNAMNAAEKTTMLTYINSYGIEQLTYNAANNQFEISSDDELKYLLYGIEQRFYTTHISNEKRLANSVQAL